MDCNLYKIVYSSLSIYLLIYHFFFQIFIYGKCLICYSPKRSQRHGINGQQPFRFDFSGPVTNCAAPSAPCADMSTTLPNACKETNSHTREAVKYSFAQRKKK